MLLLQWMPGRSRPFSPVAGARRFALIAAAVLPGGGAAQSAGQERPGEFSLRHIDVDVAVDFRARSVTGSAALRVRNTGTTEARTVRARLHRLIEVERVDDGRGQVLSYNSAIRRVTDWPTYQANFIDITLPSPIRPGKEATVRVTYSGTPTGMAETGMLYVRDAVDSTFTILRDESLVWPVLGGTTAAEWSRVHADYTYRARISADAGTVVANAGRLVRTDTARTSGARDWVMWEYLGERPVPFLLIALAPYRVLDANGTRVYHFPADSSGARRLLRSVTAARAELTRVFGPLPEERSLAIIQIPSGYGSQANAIAGIIQTADAFRDSTRLHEAYHEIAHLWQPEATEVPRPRWEEGLSSFMEWRLARQLDGYDRVDTIAARTIRAVSQRVAKDTILQRYPLADYGRLRATDWSYRIGMLAFYSLWKVVGEAPFDATFRALAAQHLATGASIDDLVALAPVAGGCDGRALLDDWLRSTRWNAFVQNAAGPEALVAAQRRRYCGAGNGTRESGGRR